MPRSEPFDGPGRTVVAPAGPVRADITVPTSKSHANRALVCAALSDGASTLTGLPEGNDTRSMLGALETWGAKVSSGDDARARIVTGSVHAVRRGGVTFRCGLAGTTSRFLTGAAALGADWTVIDGDDPLRRRPNEELLVALEAIGAEVERPDGGALPVRVRRSASGVGGEVVLDASVSSQFISALMLAAPLMDRRLDLVLAGEMVSRPYVEMTAEVMRVFGAEVIVDGDHVRVEPTGYTGCAYAVEGDFSSAAFPLVAPILRPGNVTVGALNPTSRQGDSAIVGLLESAGVAMSWTGDRLTASVPPGTYLRPFQCDLRDCSDLLPALCVAASAIDGPSRFTGVGFVRRKESDRLGDMAGELARFGVMCDLGEDGITVHGRSTPAEVRGIPMVAVHHDHRLAMSLALLSLRHGPVAIDDQSVVAKSWPSYWRDMEAILGG